MGDLGGDTAVESVRAGVYRAAILKSWENWGPLGGYVAALAVRAAGAERPFERLASVSCNFVRPGAFDAVDITVDILRVGRTAGLQRVEIAQQGKLVLESTIWSAAGPERVDDHDLAVAPAVPSPAELTFAGTDDMHTQFPFSQNLSARFVPPVEDAPPEPVWRAWGRFEPVPTFADPWVDAARALIILDIAGHPAASSARNGHTPFIAPSLSLHVVFHQSAASSDWLLVDGHAPVSKDGLLGWHGHVWSEQGDLVATGSGQNLCRPF